jgi:Icc protein
MEDEDSSSRRSFLRASVGLGAAGLLGCRAGEAGAPIDVGPNLLGNERTSDTGDAGCVGVAEAVAAPAAFRFAVITDTHVIDEWYRGPEGSPLDTESILRANERLDIVVDRINSLEKPVDVVIHVGDLVHTLAQCGSSCDLDFQYDNRTSIDLAAEKMARLNAPYQICFGNHDYEFESLPREDVHSLFAHKVGETMPPYGVYEHHGWKFITLNSYLGNTHAEFQDPLNGSCGEEQLLWLEAQLAERKPTMIFLHQMLQIMEQTEVRDFGLHSLLRQYEDTIPWVLAGHTHRWLPFGRQFGPEHMVIGATRYDEDSFVIGEASLGLGEVSFLNQATWETLTPFSERWEEEG